LRCNESLIAGSTATAVVENIRMLRESPVQAALFVGYSTTSD